MAAKAVVALRAEHIESWDRFQRLAELQVQECNAVAGECLWRTATAPDRAPLFSVQSTARPGISVECSFDVEHGMLTCKPGSAIQADTLEFQFIGETVVTLRRGGGEFTLEQALGLVLDELVSVD
jgi:hypothetical protein